MGDYDACAKCAHEEVLSGYVSHETWSSVERMIACGQYDELHAELEEVKERLELASKKCGVPARELLRKALAQVLGGQEKENSVRKETEAENASDA